MLDAIEKEYGFVYPQLYKQLYHEGMLNWGTLGSGWYQTVYPTLKSAPPFLIYGDDFEIMELPDIQEWLSKGPPYGDKGHRFVPFGYTGAGDWYAFYLNLQEGDNIPVVQVWHDANRACVLAKNLQDFIFSQMLHAITDQEDNDSLITDGDLKENCQNFLRTHGPYLTPHQRSIVADAYEKGSLKGKELFNILSEEINFEWLDKCFPYQAE
ncbi:MAG TPA: SMI1/KNR4 family protein [Chitinophaga sp.]|uniref:SMI1/KNR4 family protein n=1 Tax=Chitinophaga sp. TaxID=1869181 RepID=UPI002B57BAA9|nr:SMI1/KNR4 family protein [Chitinophaga sp.]HVI44479.1 SMI1/KNR4 family protein [Chitinophaga sp.]